MAVPQTASRWAVFPAPHWRRHPIARHRIGRSPSQGRARRDNEQENSFRRGPSPRQACGAVVHPSLLLRRRSSLACGGFGASAVSCGCNTVFSQLVQRRVEGGELSRWYTTLGRADVPHPVCSKGSIGRDATKSGDRFSFRHRAGINAMAMQIAVLRAVNVGGRSSLKMSDLRALARARFCRRPEAAAERQPHF